MKRLFNMSIKTKLILSFALLLIVPIFTVGLLSYNTAKNQTEDQLLYEAEGNVDVLNLLIQNNIAPRLNDVNIFSSGIIAGSVSADLDENTDLYNRFNEYLDLNEDIASIYVGTRDGVMVQSPRRNRDTAFDPRERPWYQDAMAKRGDTIITNPYISSIDDIVMVTIAKTTVDGAGVIGIDVPLTTIDNMAAMIHIGQDGYTMILDKDQNFVSHPEIDTVEMDESFFGPLYAEDSGRFTYTMDGEDRELIFTTDELTGWKIAGTMLTSEVNTAARPILYSVLFVSVIALLLGGVAALFIVRSIVRPLNLLAASATRIKDGDLTEVVEIDSDDEIGVLAQSFNEMAASLRSLIQEVDMGAEQVAASSEELTASSEQTMAASENVSTGIEQVATGAETQEAGLKNNAEMLQEIATAIGRVARNAHAVSELSVTASTQAEEGGTAAKKSIDQMRSISGSVAESSEMIRTLNKRSIEIDTIVDVIVGIADQTNLLSLNAAIEAARAGEQGKGFAVVADEVRKLAEQSQHSANQISELITGIQSDTENSVRIMDIVSADVETGMKLSDETTELFTTIIESIQHIAPQIEDVAAIAEQIEASVSEITDSVLSSVDVSVENASASEEIAAATQEQLASMEEITAASRSLSVLAENLQTLIRQFRV